MKEELFGDSNKHVIRRIEQSNSRIIIQSELTSHCLDNVSRARKMTPKYQEEFSKFQQLRIAKNS